MYLTPDDIASYVFCPLSYKKQVKISNKLTFLEKCIRQTFIAGEQAACLKDSIVTPKKFMQEWDKIWWPAVAANRDLKMKRAEELTVKASYKFTDYCKYDVSDWMYPTLGTSVENDIRIGDSILRVSNDVVKINLHKKNNNVVLVNFNKGLMHKNTAFDPAIQARAYAMHKNADVIIHINVDISNKQDGVRLITSTFRKKDIDTIRKMLYYVEYGIRMKNFHANPYKCEECGECQVFTS